MEASPPAVPVEDYDADQQYEEYSLTQKSNNIVSFVSILYSMVDNAENAQFVCPVAQNSTLFIRIDSMVHARRRTVDRNRQSDCVFKGCLAKILQTHKFLRICSTVITLWI